MKDTDRILIGTSWTRTGGQHNPKVGDIDRITAKGPRVKAHDGFYRITWTELGLTWNPSNKRSQDSYELWQLAERANYLEKKEAQFLQTIEREIEMPENGVQIMDHPETGVKECHGPWHRHGDSYELRPLTEFSITTRGPHPGQLSAICDSCRAKQRESDRRRKAIKRPPPKVVIAPPPIVIEPVIETEAGEVYRWKVTVIQKVEHFVQGKDFLDAAAQLSGTGEVVKVEKL